jgi:hypothetical protein
LNVPKSFCPPQQFHPITQEVFEYQPCVRPLRRMKGLSIEQDEVCTFKEVRYSWEGWYMPIIPATWEAEVGESLSEASPGRSLRLYLKTD